MLPLLSSAHLVSPYTQSFFLFFSCHLFLFTIK
jgi:hypothetical protein